MDDNSRLLENGELSSKRSLVFRKNYFGSLFNFFRSREKFYIFYSFILLASFSIGFVYKDIFSFISLLDNLSDKFSLPSITLFYLFLIIDSFVVLIFSFTFFSKIFNSISLFFVGSLLGSFSVIYTNNFFLLNLFTFSLFGMISFFAMFFITECDVFSGCVVKRGISNSRKSEIINLFATFIFYFVAIFIFGLIHYFLIKFT